MFGWMGWEFCWSGGRSGGSAVVLVEKGGVCVWMFGGKTPRLPAASPLLCCSGSLFFYAWKFPLFTVFHAECGGRMRGRVGVDTPGRAALTLGVFWNHGRLVSVHRAEPRALRCWSFKRLNWSVKKRFVAANVFFCVCWRAERWGRWRWRRRRGGGLGGSEAPDADPLKKNKGGVGGAAEKRLKSQAKRRKGVKTSRELRDAPQDLPAAHAPHIHLCFTESAFPRPSMC